jgi:magnesium transporter
LAHTILIPEFKRLIKEKEIETLKEFFLEFHPKRSAEFLEMLQPAEIWFVLSLIDIDDACSIFSYFEVDRQIELLHSADKKIARKILEDFSSDDRADLFKALDEETYQKFITYLSEEEREDVEDLIAHKEGTAGAVMSTDFMYCYIDQTIEDLFFYLREHGSSKETIYYIYIIDELEHLKGMLTLKDAVLSKPEEKISEIMSTDLVTGELEDDQEDIARLFEEYDILALPIVDSEGVLKGIVTHDDVIDILQEEQTEDVERMMAISGVVEDRDYLDVPIYVHFKKRIPWILGLFFLGIVTSKVIGHYEDVLSQVVILAFFFPLLNGTGGNTGAQSASMVLRSITLETLKDTQYLRAFVKEFFVSLLVGSVLFIIMYISFYTFNFGAESPFPVWKIALSVSLAMAFQVISATLIGASLPMIASKLNLDPAVVAMPAITTIVDFTGLIIYFNIAKMILGV